MRIPLDPERMAFSPNKNLSEIQKYHNYARNIIGIRNLADLKKRGLWVVPKKILTEYLKTVDTETFNEFCEQFIHECQSAD